MSEERPSAEDPLAVTDFDELMAKVMASVSRELAANPRASKVVVTVYHNDARGVSREFQIRVELEGTPPVLMLRPQRKPETAAKAPARRTLTPVARRLIENGAEIRQEPPDKADFLHTALCQVGMPRSRFHGQSFTRTNGGLSLKVEAGKLWDGREWCPQPLPYGTRPRLVMVHISSEAVRTRSREIEVGHSIQSFLETLGIGTSGGRTGAFAMFKAQMLALAACRMTIGMSAGGRVRTVDAKPIEQFDAWLHPTDEQRTLWPGTMTLSTRFYETLLEHAVPLDKRALGSLQHSALALDVYTWLAYRLCRIDQPEGVRLSWGNLHDQFGQEYAERRDFKREMRRALRRALRVYPDARVDGEPGGIRLRPSPPPIPKTLVPVALPPALAGGE